MAWTVIPDSDIDADSSVDDGILTDIVENAEYNHDHAVRCGTHNVGVRLAIARGKTAFATTIDISGNLSTTHSVVFANADDGVPGFSATPVFKYTFQEDLSGGAVAWSNFTIDSAAMFVTYINALDETGATIEIRIRNSADTGSLKGWIHWIAIGLVTSGE